ncbi:MAG: tetratricopeptide repeat protein [Steroidobacteraceae bacterium]
MPSYSVRDVERVLHLSAATTRGLIRAGFVSPTRGAKREYRFSFQDLIVLRTARALIQANVPRQRIRRSLESLKRELPESMPLSGLAICAVGDRVVVREGDNHRQADSGQYLLGLDVSVENGVLRMVEHPRGAAPAPAPSPTGPHDWFAEGLALEAADPKAALEAYRRAAEADPDHTAAWINLGRLLHEQGATLEAETVYRRALEQVGPDPLLLFNQGVLLEDLGRTQAALTAYQNAVAEDPSLADGHYNLARLYESLGEPQHAIRHLGQYRRLMGSEGR